MTEDCVTWTRALASTTRCAKSTTAFLLAASVGEKTITLDTLTKTASESIEATLRRRWILFALFVARMEDTRLPKCAMLGQMLGGADCVGGQENEWMGDSWTTSELSASTPTSGRLHPRTRGNGAGRRNKKRNVSWRNGALQRRPGLDYDMQ